MISFGTELPGPIQQLTSLCIADVIHVRGSNLGVLQHEAYAVRLAGSQRTTSVTYAGRPVDVKL